jgi:hypothetical protein
MKLQIVNAAERGNFGLSISLKNEYVLEESINITYILNNKKDFCNWLVIYKR